MTLADIFRDLTYGELSQLAIGNLVPDDEESAPAPKDYAKIMSHINLALKELYKRFFLSSKELRIQQYNHIETYVLDSKYAETNTLSPEPYKYIVDSQYDPFLDDVLKIEQVFDEDGRGLFLNDRTEPWSLYTPTYRSIQVPYPMSSNTLLVHYRASHPTINFEHGMDPRDIEIMIPDGLMEPLLFYVASRAFGSLNTDQNAEGNNYLQKFEASCKRISDLGLQVTPQYGNHRLDNNGWV